MQLKVNSKDIFIDNEDELLYVEYLLERLQYEWCLPRWAYLRSEWSEYLIKKSAVERRLRKLKENISYTIDSTAD